MASWNFLTNRTRVLLCIAHDPGARLRDIAARAGITECSACAIVTDLTMAGHVMKQKDGRRNRYRSSPTPRCQTSETRTSPSVRSWPCLPPPTRGNRWQ